jgi:hypothetical protein
LNLHGVSRIAVIFSGVDQCGHGPEIMLSGVLEII